MKRRKFIQGSTTIASGLGFSAISFPQLESTKTEQSHRDICNIGSGKSFFL